METYSKNHKSIIDEHVLGQRRRWSCLVIITDIGYVITLFMLIIIKRSVFTMTNYTVKKGNGD